MVKRINVALDDDVHERGTEVKDAHGWTWEEFIEEAIDEFDDE